MCALLGIYRVADDDVRAVGAIENLDLSSAPP
jgi:hypothetical protein